LSLVVPFPEGEKFSELWILGPERMTEDYPFNVSTGEDFQIYLGVGNHMGGLRHYKVYVKFRNQTGVLPNATTGTPSPLEPLYEFQVFLKDGETWEGPFTFSFSEVSFSENRSLIEGIVLNDQVLEVDREASWDIEDRGYYYQLFFELWLFDSDFDDFVFQNRFVGFWLNMTEV
jgi:uncharacterized membrane protein